MTGAPNEPDETGHAFSEQADAAVRRIEELRDNVARRAALAGEPQPAGVHGPPLKRLLGELAVFAEPIHRINRDVTVAPAQHPRIVMLLPGFGTHPLRMRHMARQLERAGHRVKRWGLGFNFGPTPENLDQLAERLLDLHGRYQQPVVLVGWSLGGIFARELAKRHPDAVAKVITMGTPFSGNPRANNAWRIYQLVAGHSVDSPPVEDAIATKPPVPTVALWSPRDGIVAPRASCGRAGERDRAVALRCTHLGFAYSEESIAAVLHELDCD